jgi:hypothetical protein
VALSKGLQMYSAEQQWLEQVANKLRSLMYQRGF